MNKGIIFLLLLFLVFLKAQQDDNSFTWLEKDNKGIKKIEILKNGKVGVTQFFNKQGNPVFIKNNQFNGNKVIAIWFYKYDNFQKLIYSVFAHSNVGFEDFEYNYSKELNQVYSHLSDSDKDKYDFDNNFPFLTELETIKDSASLFNSKSYKSLIKRKKYLISKDVLKENKMIETITFTEGTKSSSIKYKYEKNKIIWNYESKNFGNSQGERKLDEKNRIIEQINFKTKHQYIYDNNFLKEENEIEDGQLISNIKYYYQNGLLVKKVTAISGVKSFTDLFYYNERGDLKSQIIEKMEGKTTYEYQYEYY